jgi:hypothetical protein
MNDTQALSVAFKLFADAREQFFVSHAADYKSEETAKEYNLGEDARETIFELLDDLLMSDDGPQLARGIADAIDAACRKGA